MSLVQRKRRPLTRDSASLRDDRLFIIACDDTYAPKQYFQFFRLPRVQVHVFASENGACGASHVLDRLLSVNCEEDDERWLLLDTDHYTNGAHVKEFMKVIRDARRKGIYVALSKPCFEIWLLLHHVNGESVSTLANAKAAERALRKELGRYDKRHLKPEDYPILSIPTACNEAERLDATVAGGNIPQGNTSRVYMLWKAIVAKALPSQLPLELKGLLP
jgi:hypothetical protein